MTGTYYERLVRRRLRTTCAVLPPLLPCPRLCAASSPRPRPLSRCSSDHRSLCECGERTVPSQKAKPSSRTARLHVQPLITPAERCSGHAALQDSDPCRHPRQPVPRHQLTLPSRAQTPWTRRRRRRRSRRSSQSRRPASAGRGCERAARFAPPEARPGWSGSKSLRPGGPRGRSPLAGRDACGRMEMESC